MKPLTQRTTVREILELTSAQPTLEEVKTNYKRLVKLYHPDINKSAGAEEYMKKINQAYALAIQALNRPQQPRQQPTHQEQYRGEIIITVSFYGGYNSYTYTTGTKR